VATILFKGKSPWQLFDAVCWRVRILIRRSFLSVLRRLNRRREENWIRSQPQIRFALTPDEAKAILKSDAGAESAIFSEAAGVLSGWTEVPGFGQREIRLEAQDLHKPEEAYAHRLLCRLDFLRLLLRASLIAADKSAYVNAIGMHLLNWHEVRRRSSGWDSVDEAIRVLNLIETLSFLQGTLTAEARAAGLRSLTNAAWLIQADRTRTGNHLIYEGLALFYAGVCLPTHYRARAWLKLGHRILEKAMQQQVYDDGMNGELSTNYHLITGTNFLKAWVLGKKFGFDFSEAFQAKLARMAGVASLLRSDDGGFLALGDTDRMVGSSREETEAKAFAELGEILSGEGRKEGCSPELRLLLAGFDSDSFENEEIPRKEQLYSAGGLIPVCSDCPGFRITVMRTVSPLRFICLAVAFWWIPAVSVTWTKRRAPLRAPLQPITPSGSTGRIVPRSWVLLALAAALRPNRRVYSVSMVVLSSALNTTAIPGCLRRSSTAGD